MIGNIGKALLILAIVTLSSSQLKANYADSTKTEPKDTIFMLSGKKIICDIVGVTSGRVKYRLLNDKEIKEEERKQIEYLIFKNGRFERFNKPVFQMLDEGDWRTVILTENEDDIVGLYELGKIKAKSPHETRTARAAKKNAQIRAQKQAAKMGGIIVLITKRELKGGYGEIPSYTIWGKVFGYEPPPKEEGEEN